jgi:hypothetical protein
MPSCNTTSACRFRVWILRYDQWEPQSLRDWPPRATAVEPAEPGTMSARAAATYVEAFNRAALRACRRRWAVAVPVVVRYEGEPRAGEVVCADCS